MTPTPSTERVATSTDERDAEIEAYIERQPRRLDLPHRESEVATIISMTFDFDREALRGEEALRFELGCDKPLCEHHPETPIAHPHRIADLAGVYLPQTYAQLATVLHGPVSGLVDRCLDVSEDWRFLDWPTKKQIDKLRGLFEEAGLAERFVMPYWVQDDS